MSNTNILLGSKAFLPDPYLSPRGLDTHHPLRLLHPLAQHKTRSLLSILLNLIHRKGTRLLNINKHFLIASHPLTINCPLYRRDNHLMAARVWRVRLREVHHTTGSITLYHRHLVHQDQLLQHIRRSEPIPIDILMPGLCQAHLLIPIISAISFLTATVKILTTKSLDMKIS